MPDKVIKATEVEQYHMVDIMVEEPKVEPLDMQNMEDHQVVEMSAPAIQVV